MLSCRGMKFPGYITAPVEMGQRVSSPFFSPVDGALLCSRIDLHLHLRGKCRCRPVSSHGGRLAASIYYRIIFLTFIRSI